jgi:hypothetical protein
MIFFASLAPQRSPLDRLLRDNSSPFFFIEFDSNIDNRLYKHKRRLSSENDNGRNSPRKGKLHFPSSVTPAMGEK